MALIIKIIITIIIIIIIIIIRVLKNALTVKRLFISFCVTWHLHDSRKSCHVG